MRVLIVGGGSAGWIAAATLLFRLNSGQAGPVEITVLESPDVPRIGVGEATIPTVRNMLAAFGIREAEFMRSCDATVKHAVRFDDWTGPSSRYLHPFQRFNDRHAQTAVSRWLDSDGGVPFSDLVSAQGHLIEARLAPRKLSAGDYGGTIPYGYHMDAEMFAGFLAQHCIRRGVRHMRGHVVESLRDGETGQLRSVRTSDGNQVAADLFLDCTGFNAVLSDRHDRRCTWQDQSNHLLCDRAATMRVPMLEGARPAPFTRARALEAGWCWDIGLRSRRGRGYVYSSTHCSDEAAEAALRAEEGRACAGLDVRVVKFRVGRREGSWAGNVVSLGLASGFLEPLESTGLFFSHLSARMLCEMFPPAPEHAASQVLSKRFNRSIASVHDAVLDFVQLHYALAQRPEPFWQQASDPDRLSDNLRELLELWNLRPPAFVDLKEPFSPFTQSNYEFILMGNGWRPSDHPYPGRKSLSPHPMTQSLANGLPSLGVFSE